jgi:cyanophycinase-like exopeptidase
MTDHKTLELMGSGEFEPWTEEVDRFSLSRAEFGDGSVVILPTASAPEGDDVFNRWAGMGLDHYKLMGVHARVIDLKTREDAFLDVLIEELANPSMIFFSGGNPLYLAATLEDTPFWKAILDAVERGTALAGCSAGACFVGELTPDSTVMRLEEMTWRHGLAVVPDTVFGPHWDMVESYVPGLKDFILSHVPEGHRFVGLDEHTAMAGDGEEWQVFGAGGVHIRHGEEWWAFHEGQSFTFESLRRE